MMRIKLYNFANEEERQVIIKILGKIAKKDDTFKFEYDKSVIYVIGDNKDTLMKRGVWIVKKLNENLKFTLLYK